MKVYLAGRMTGVKHYNFPKFFKFQRALEKAGWNVFNPAEEENDKRFAEGQERPKESTTKWSRKDFFLKDVIALHACDGIMLMDDWHLSEGARTEVACAINSRMPVWEVRETDDDGTISVTQIYDGGEKSPRPVKIKVEVPF